MLTPIEAHEFEELIGVPCCAAEQHSLLNLSIATKRSFQLVFYRATSTTNT